MAIKGQFTGDKNPMYGKTHTRFNSFDIYIFMMYKLEGE